MPVVGDDRTGTLATCLAVASDFRFLGEAVKDLIARQVDTIRDGRDDLCRRPDRPKSSATRSTGTSF